MNHRTPPPPLAPRTRVAPLRRGSGLPSWFLALLVVAIWFAAVMAAGWPQ